MKSHPTCEAVRAEVLRRQLAGRIASVVQAAKPQPSAVLSAHDRIRNSAEATYQDAVHRLAVAAEADAVRKRKREELEAELLLLWLATMEDAGKAAYQQAEDDLGELEAGELWEDAGVETAATSFASSRRELLRDFPSYVYRTVTTAHDEAEAAGLPPAEVRRKVREAGQAAERGRGKVVAATEAQATYGSAQLRVLQRAGYATKVWVTMEDEKVRPSHVDCGEVGAVPLGQPFPNGLQYPGDPNGGPEEVANCRCVLMPGTKQHFVQATDSGQRRAKPGGEYGANGEWYEGGEWIANTDSAKTNKVKPRPTGRRQVEPGVWETQPTADHLAIYPSLAGVEKFNRSTGKFEFNKELTGDNFASPESIVNRKERINQYNNGERWRVSPLKKISAGGAA